MVNKNSVNRREILAQWQRFTEALSQKIDSGDMDPERVSVGYGALLAVCSDVMVGIVSPGKMPALTDAQKEVRASNRAQEYTTKIGLFGSLGQSVTAGMLGKACGWSEIEVAEDMACLSSAGIVRASKGGQGTKVQRTFYTVD